jgi:eukaryotic-like serine/threonine-protein kinase
VRIGDHIAGRYRLLRPLGSGGMGEVWAALNELTNREFAIKFLLPEFAHNEEAFERFVREAKTTGTLKHPSIVDVYDVAMGKGNTPFIVMELLHGEELESLIDREGALSPLKTAAYFAQISCALQMAHDAGVIHRDLSTNNIFLTRGDDAAVVPKILDFGVSKTLGPQFEGQSVTMNGAILGNPIFMSPEQARGAGGVDARTDIWSLGVSMYQALTGTIPFRNTNYNALMVDIMTRTHRPILELVPTLDKELAQVIEHCLHKDRDKRLESAAQLADRLTSIARRLSTDPTELGRTPRRRATDHLPTPTRATRDSMAKAGIPLPLRVFRALGLPPPSRLVVALFALTIGVVGGVWVGRGTDSRAQVIIHAATPTADALRRPVAARAVEQPVAPVRLTPQTDIPPGVEADEKLKQAVIRGLSTVR